MPKKDIIIVTGGAGFVGTNLIKLLLKKTKYKIVSLDDYSSGTKLNHIRSPRIKYIKGKTVNIDCDVIQADGGTRTASITGGCVALFLAIKNHHDDQRAIKSFVAAVSFGIKDNKVLLDLDYDEDSSADTALNIVMNDKDELIEIQGTAEDAPFSKNELNDMLELGSSAIAEIIKKQKACIE